MYDIVKYFFEKNIITGTKFDKKETKFDKKLEL